MKIIINMPVIYIWSKKEIIDTWETIHKLSTVSFC